MPEEFGKGSDHARRQERSIRYASLQPHPRQDEVRQDGQSRRFQARRKVRPGILCICIIPETILADFHSVISSPSPLHRLAPSYATSFRLNRSLERTWCASAEEHRGSSGRRLPRTSLRRWTASSQPFAIWPTTASAYHLVTSASPCTIALHNAVSRRPASLCQRAWLIHRCMVEEETRLRAF